MAHDVFISHSAKDKAVADATCAALEAAGIRCWIGPRDVQPARSYAGEINRAIQNSKAMVIIFSAHSNNSEHVLREVQLAVGRNLHIVQFRIEDVRLNDDLEYFLSAPHWLDALSPPLEKHLERLKASIKTLLDTPAKQSGNVSESASSSAQDQHTLTAASNKPPVPESPTPKKGRGRKLQFAGVIAALLTVVGLPGWWFGVERPRRDERQRHLREQKKDMVQREMEEEAKRRKDPLQASKEQPFENSLGMKFVPVPGTNVLFGIWETRVKDYKAFAEATERRWHDPNFQQTDEHPAVNISWEDATAFCEWLTEQESTLEQNSAKQYRLPSDEEWSAAVGLERERGSTPKARDGKVKGAYPWGTKWPPPNGAGNYDPDFKVDDFEKTSPVASFEANRYGIYDLGGNVWEWCQDWYETGDKYRVVRGASWDFNNPNALLSSCRSNMRPDFSGNNYGFRCVLEVESLR